MKTRTTVKAGGLKTINHNEKLKVRTGINAGKLAANHNTTLKVRSGIRGGKLAGNHNEKLGRR